MMFYLVPLVLTILIEEFTVFLLGFKEKDLYLNIIIMNIITNPTLNCVLKNTIYYFEDYSFYYIIFLEILVVLFEWIFLKIRLKSEKLPFFQIAFITNATSFLVGLIISELL